MAAMLVNGRLFGLAAMLANPHCFAGLVKTDKKPKEIGGHVGIQDYDYVKFKP